MTTQLVNQWRLPKVLAEQWQISANDKQCAATVKKLIVRDIYAFVDEIPVTQPGPLLQLLNSTYQQVVNELTAKRWVVLADNRYVDKQAQGVWIIDKSYGDFDSGTKLSTVKSHINSQLDDSLNVWSIATEATMKNLYQISQAPFILRNGRPNIHWFLLYLNSNGTVQARDYDSGCYDSRSTGSCIPYLQLSSCKHPKKLFIELLQKGLYLESLSSNVDYEILMEIIQEEEQTAYPDAQRIITTMDNYLIGNNIEMALLQMDRWRVDLTPYHPKMLQDTEQGHWALWPQPESDNHTEEWVTINLPKPLVARDPKSSINNGVVGIDFGTKSTVVVYQKDNVNIHPMRIGTGDLTKAVAAYHYENPTIMQFCNVDKFIEQYQQADFRPCTQWQQLTISHTAQSALLGSPSSLFNTFLDELKQWAGDKNRCLKIVDQHATVIDLPPFLEMTDDQFNPLEIYAYYLGLYINNQNNGIFLDYILSFPVTYELAIRERILASFERGLKKSLPPQLDAESIAQLSVTQGASEPAAYALVALQQYQFAPQNEQRIFYSVFDFGGGTTDFDFGIYREAQGAKERRFDYVIEHFGAGGDRFLGGENLLKLLAFYLFKKNAVTLLAKGIQFERHPELDAFAGSEQLLAHSQEAKTNTKALCELLRPFWEGQEIDFNSGVIGLNLTDVNGTVHSNIELDIDGDELVQLLRDRIERGVVNFFNALRLAFSQQHSLGDITEIKIFLAGNSSRSKLVTELFAKHIQQQEQQMELSGDQHCFELFAPLGSDDNDIERPTGKTGVAFGLIESREGGRIKVVDHNIQDDEIRFRYYLGENRRGQFKTLVNRETAFGQWIDFIDAGYHKFEIYYTEQPLSSTNELPINDSSIKKLVVRIDHIDDNALVYLRIVSPTAIEWVVANEEDIVDERYLTEPQRLDF